MLISAPEDVDVSLSLPDVSSYPSRAARLAARELAAMQARMADLRAQQGFLADVAGLSPQIARPSAWPTDISELAAKIARLRGGGLRSFEQQVTNADRNLVTQMLPPACEVQRNDPPIY